VLKDTKAPNISFEKYLECIKLDNEKGRTLLERFKDALSNNAVK
jgi:hypothetical protein